MDKKIKDLIKSLELELLQSETRKSKKRLDELLSDDFFEFMQSGKRADKQVIIETLPKSLEFTFKMRDFDIKEIASGAVLVSYVLDRHFLETKENRCTLCSSIWQKNNNSWQMIFFQGTPAS